MWTRIFSITSHVFGFPLLYDSIIFLILDYTRHTLDGAACLLNSNKYFPSRVSIKVINHQDYEVVILWHANGHQNLVHGTVEDCHPQLRRAVSPSWVPFVAEFTASSPTHTFITGNFLLCILSQQLAFFHVPIFCYVYFPPPQANIRCLWKWVSPMPEIHSICDEV